jgi:hypothetical protein
MHISDIFQKLGIKGFDDLKADEKKVYEAWAKTLHKPDVTIEDLKRILPGELDRTDRELEKHETEGNKQSYLKAYAGFCRFLITVISGPKKERAALEQQLRQKFKL